VKNDAPRIVQEGLNEATTLSLVSTGMGFGWVIETAGARCPNSIVVIPVTDLNILLPLSLVWRKGNGCPLLAGFIHEVRSLPDVKTKLKTRA
jgi:DNA-binding transcriptional LysR family regulator